MPIARNDDTEDILHFSLQGLLDQGQTLALEMRLGFVALLSCEQDHAYLLKAVQLTPSEMYITIPLLEAYPFFCPYEVLLASVNGRPTEQAIERCRLRLQDAEEEGTWDIEMKPVRNTLSRARIKTRQLGIDFVSLMATGYMLVRPRH
jgi:hypothetical protein